MATAHNITAELKQVRHFGKDLVLLRLFAPSVALAATPGQFVMLGPLDPRCMDPFLCRPISIFGVTDEGELDLLIAAAGRGTRMISAWTEGLRVELTGPLGHGFESDTKNLLLVGGGVGVAPLVFLADTQLAKGRKCTLLYGAARSEMMVDLQKLQDRGCLVKLATDDGSVGHHGLVTDLLSKHLSASHSHDTLVAACGPSPMLKEVWRNCSEHGVDLQVSLENRMACGTGACMGCSLLISGKALRVCKQGPVFSGGEVFQ